MLDAPPNVKLGKPDGAIFLAGSPTGPSLSSSFRFVGDPPEPKPNWNPGVVELPPAEENDDPLPPLNSPIGAVVVVEGVEFIPPNELVLPSPLEVPELPNAFAFPNGFPLENVALFPKVDELSNPLPLADGLETDGNDDPVVIENEDLLASDLGLPKTGSNTNSDFGFSSSFL